MLEEKQESWSDKCKITKWRIIGVEGKGVDRGQSILGLIAHEFYFECNWTP